MGRFLDRPGDQIRRYKTLRRGWDHGRFGMDGIPPVHIWRNRAANDNEPSQHTGLPERFRNAGVPWLAAVGAAALGTALWVYDRWINSIL